MSAPATILSHIRSRRERRTGRIEQVVLERIVIKPIVLAITAFARLFTGVEVRWLGCAAEAKQRIYIANHTSHADFILLWSSLAPRLRARTRPVAAADYWTRGRLRRFLSERVFRAIMVQRDGTDRSRNPLAPVLRGLANGDSIILFPEGTRGSGREVAAFKCGIYQLALACPEVEIIPVWIGNLNRVLPKGAILPVPLLCSVTFGEPTRLAADEDKAAFLSRVRQRLTAVGETCKSTNSC